ncbi:MAG: hypothetical protein K0U52_05230 [Gammaproteobacteria bacterium]|nr:hypothetical protein [Gammaproteobacteria bacterium]
MIQCRQLKDDADAGTIGKRWELLDEKLKTYRHDKMKQKLPVDSQMLGCAQEELAIKRQQVEQVDKMDQRYAETMDKMSQNMKKLTSSIADGFLLLKQMMGYQQPPTMYHPQAYNPYGSPTQVIYDIGHAYFRLFPR